MRQLADCLPAKLKSPSNLEIGAISYRQDHGDLNDTIALFAEGSSAPTLSSAPFPLDIHVVRLSM
jgi:hypothetical protein